MNEMTKLAVIGAGVLAAPLAQADTMLVSETAYISGTQSNVYSLAAPGAGSITISLTNLEWPERLASLSFAFTTATGVLQSGGAGELTFDLAGPGTYYALVTGTAQGHWDLGLYSLNLSWSPAPTAPVPLPAGLWLLLSGAGVVFGLARPKKRVS